MVLCQALIRTGRNISKSVKLLNYGVKSNTNIKQAQLSRFLYTTSINFGERRFTRKHEWVLVEGNIATVGISKYAQEALGDVVYAQLPDAGTSLSQKDECGALESVKAASEVYSPVSGEVTEKNSKVEDSPALINSSCYDNGWLFKVNITKPDELKDLMNEKEYEDFLKSDDAHN